MKARARRASDRGFEFATVLERGQVLREGDCFVFDSPALVVVVVELAEPVLIVRPETPPEWALYGYHIGNGHQPLMVTEREIVCADDAGAEQLLRYHAIPFTRGTRPFTPVGQSPAHRHPVMR